MPGQGTFLVIDDDADVLTTARLLLRWFKRILEIAPDAVVC
ncbi:MAG: hypothetical protein AAGA68_22920 [Pseudomonadota bacterium]